MTVMTDWQIVEEVKRTGLIDPFVDHQVREVNGIRVISYGLSSAGYDIRVADEWKRPLGQALSPKNPQENQWQAFTDSNPILLSPGHFILGRSVEQFNVPRTIMGTVTSKSTYCRVGVFPNISPLESGWNGFLTIEIANIGHCPVFIYPNEGIAQVVFQRIKEVSVSYADRSGKYQGTTGVVLGRV